MTADDDGVLVHRVVVFRHEDVQAFLKAIGGDPVPIELVKDDGAYLAAWPARTEEPVTVFAVGHESPDLFRRPGTDDGVFDAGWIAQRSRVEQSFGGDDFGRDVDPALLREASADGDVVFVTTVRMLPWPKDMPDLTGRRDPIPRLVSARGPMAAVNPRLGHVT